MLIRRGLTGVAILAVPIVVLLGLALVVRLGLGFAFPSLGIAIIAAAAIRMWWKTRERTRSPLCSPRESRRAFARILAASAAAMILTLAGSTFLLSTIVAPLLGPVSDDRCERLSSGEPIRHDPDCQNDPWSGVNHIEAWDRYHGAP